MASRRPMGVMGRLLIAFGSVSVAAVVVFLAVEGLGVDAGLDAVAPAEEGISRRVHGFLYRWTIVSGAIALVLGIALAARFTLLFVRPVRSLAANASAFAAGARDVRCEAGCGIRELDELARSFNAMADKLQAHEASRNRLLSDIAHELRSPLTVVSGQLEEMRDGLVPVDREALAAVHAECQRLAATAEDLARLAAEDATGAAMSSSVLDLGAVAGQAVAVREKAFRDAGMPLLVAGDGATIRSNERRLRQILGNLLDNSYRYCRPGDIVRVCVGAEDLAWMIVDDGGPGMAAEERWLATQHGFRGRNSAGIPGSGAGLALVQRWAESLGGHVELHESPLGGLRVAVLLPIGGSDLGGPGATEAPAGAAIRRPAPATGAGPPVRSSKSNGGSPPPCMPPGHCGRGPLRRHRASTIAAPERASRTMPGAGE
jgi:two-component system sensor histidine kinase BaeS